MGASEKVDAALHPLSRCPDCGKVRYGSRKEARRTAARIGHRNGRMNAYRCGAFWHLGHLPSPVRAGDWARDDIPQPRRQEPA